MLTCWRTCVHCFVTGLTNNITIYEWELRTNLSVHKHWELRTLFVVCCFFTQLTPTRQGVDRSSTNGPGAPGAHWAPKRKGSNPWRTQRVHPTIWGLVHQFFGIYGIIGYNRYRFCNFAHGRGPVPPFPSPLLSVVRGELALPVPSATGAWATASWHVAHRVP